MLAAASEGPLDQAADHVGGVNSPWVEAFAVGSPGRLAVILINRSQVARPVTLRIAGLTAPPSSARRYLFSRDRVSAFIGPPPGEKEESGLAGSPDDSPSARCLEPLDALPLSEGADGPCLDLDCPPLSLTVLNLDSAR